MTHEPRRTDAFAAAATLLSMLACYGTAIIIAALGALGVSVALNDAAWAAAIVFFALVATVSLALSRRNHGRVYPLILAVAGFLILSYAMYGSYSRLTELAGFVLLCLAVAWDWWLRRQQQRGA